jgi:UrcA family protein
MKTIILGAAALLALSALPADAAPRPAPQATIRVGDLDLSDGGDARAMLARIRKASAAVCRASPGAGGSEIAAIELYDRCFRESVARAVGQLDAPLVTAAHESRTPARRLARLP